MTNKAIPQLDWEYKVALSPIPEEDGGGWLAEIPDLPGCMADGDSPEEALEEIQLAKEAWMEAQISRGKPIPEPSKDVESDHQYSGRLTLRLPKSLHCRLAKKAEREGVSLNQYLLSLISENHVRSIVEHQMVIQEEPSEHLMRSRDNPLIWVARARYRGAEHFSPGLKPLFQQRIVSTVQEQTFES